MKNTLKIVIAVLAIALVSCGKDSKNEMPKDITAPVIEISSPNVGSLYFAGNDVYITGVCTDDVELSTLTVSVQKIIIPITKGIKYPWEPETKVYELEGTEFNFEELFDVLPIKLEPGEYEFTFKVDDAAGNETIKNIKVMLE